MSRAIEITPALNDALKACQAAARAHVPGRDAGTTLELAKLTLADALLAAVADAGRDRLDRLPVRAGVVHVRLTPIRRRRRA